MLYCTVNSYIYSTVYQSVANIRIYSNIRIFLAEYLIFEYEYKKIGIRIYSNIRTIEKLGYEYIRIFVNFLRIYSNILLYEQVQLYRVININCDK